MSNLDSCVDCTAIAVLPGLYFPTIEHTMCHMKWGRHDRLFIGTQADNVHDMETKNRGRHPNSEEHGRAKLTWQQVDDIKKRYANGEAARSLSRRFNIARTSIKNIVSGKGWTTKLFR
jgi:hypothetical protein